MSLEDIKIVHGDAFVLIDELEDNSIDVVITDPPYFFDGMDDSWNAGEIEEKTDRHGVVGYLPAGMKFDKNQTYRLYEWYKKICEKIYNKLKAGGFIFTFSASRFLHRVTCAVEDAGFNIRDGFLWIYTKSQPKAMSLNHFIKKMNVSDEIKKEYMKKVEGWKTPQVKSCYEYISVGQKPYNSTLLNNFIENSVGLFNMNVKIGEDMFPSNVLVTDNFDEVMSRYFLIEKNTIQENRIHPTQKPVELIEYLIELSTTEGATVLDPFSGSGTTAIACLNKNRKFIGFEINKIYYEKSLERLEKHNKDKRVENKLF